MLFLASFADNLRYCKYGNCEAERPSFCLHVLPNNLLCFRFSAENKCLMFTCFFLWNQNQNNASRSFQLFCNCRMVFMSVFFALLNRYITSAHIKHGILIMKIMMTTAKQQLDYFFSYVVMMCWRVQSKKRKNSSDKWKKFNDENRFSVCRVLNNY